MIKVNGKAVEVNYFPDGTPRIRLDISFGDTKVEWFYEPNEEMNLYYIVKHIKGCAKPEMMDLYLPYIPNARMDRVQNPSEVFTLKYFCEFINDLGFNKVYISDAHSNCSLIAINNVRPIQTTANIKKLIEQLSPNIIFYPDEGAMKRYSQNVRHPYLFGIKERDWNTGKIIRFNIYGKTLKTPYSVLIVDDILSYGETCLHSARKLKELGAHTIYLYVTHCENSILNGELINAGLLKKIYTTKSIFTKQHDLIEVIADNFDE